MLRINTRRLFNRCRSKVLSLAPGVICLLATAGLSACDFLKYEPIVHGQYLDYQCRPLPEKTLIVLQQTPSLAPLGGGGTHFQRVTTDADGRFKFRLKGIKNPDIFTEAHWGGGVYHPVRASHALYYSGFDYESLTKYLKRTSPEQPLVLYPTHHQTREDYSLVRKRKRVVLDHLSFDPDPDRRHRRAGITQRYRGRAVPVIKFDYRDYLWLKTYARENSESYYLEVAAGRNSALREFENQIPYQSGEVLPTTGYQARYEIPIDNLFAGADTVTKSYLLKTDMFYGAVQITVSLGSANAFTAQVVTDLIYKTYPDEYELSGGYVPPSERVLKQRSCGGLDPMTMAVSETRESPDKELIPQVLAHYAEVKKDYQKNVIQRSAAAETAAAGILALECLDYPHYMIAQGDLTLNPHAPPEVLDELVEWATGSNRNCESGHEFGSALLDQLGDLGGLSPVSYRKLRAGNVSSLLHNFHIPVDLRLELIQISGIGNRSLLSLSSNPDLTEPEVKALVKRVGELIHKHAGRRFYRSWAWKPEQTLINLAYQRNSTAEVLEQIRQLSHGVAAAVARERLDDLVTQKDSIQSL